MGLPHLRHPNPRIRLLHQLRLACHGFLLLFSLALLVVAAVVLAYSLRMYYGSFLHATPELLTAGAIAVVVLGLAWAPRGGGRYGLSCLASVGAELGYTLALCLCFFGGVTSLHRSTPGLLSNCGGFFICQGYTALLALAWLAWFASALVAGLLLGSGLYQHFRRRRGASVWRRKIQDWDWFSPDEAGSIRRFTLSASAIEAGEGFHSAGAAAKTDGGMLKPRSPAASNQPSGFALPPAELAPHLSSIAHPLENEDDDPFQRGPSPLQEKPGVYSR